MENLETSILRVFLIAKQTADDARFNYLKRLGSDKNIDFGSVNQFLQGKEGETKNKRDDRSKGYSKHVIFLTPDLYESKMPYLFPEKNFTRNFSANLCLPGFKINESHFFVVLSRNYRKL